MQTSRLHEQLPSAQNEVATAITIPGLEKIEILDILDEQLVVADACDLCLKAILTRNQEDIQIVLVGLVVQKS